ncbi:MAG: lysostaphin resistance A-like protein [Mycobacteriaceae bacterium]
MMQDPRQSDPVVYPQNNNSQTSSPWQGIRPMRSVDVVSSGYSDNYWRAEQAARARTTHQKWGLPAASVILIANLVGFIYAVSTRSPELYVLTVMFPTTLAATVVLVLSRLRGNGPVVDFGLPTTIRVFLSQIAIGLACGSVSVLGGLLLGFLIAPWQDFSSAGESPMSQAEGVWWVVIALWMWFGAPLGEELLFRGLLWGALEKRAFSTPVVWRWLGNRWVILVLTSLLFAAWHMQWWRFPVLLFGGLALGMARLLSGSIFASSVAHAVNNTLPALMVLFMPAMLGW